MTINLNTSLKTEPPKMDFIWGGFLAGTVGSLAGPSAIGKSFWALQAAMAVAGHNPDGETQGADLLDLQPSKRGRVLYIADKDPESVLAHRIHAIGKHLSNDAKQRVAENLVVEPVMGSNFDVIMASTTGSVLKSAVGCRLIVVDTILDSDRFYLMELMKRLPSLCAETGAAALILHLDKFFDAASWCSRLSEMSLTDVKRMENRSDIKEAARGTTKSVVRYDVYSQKYGRDVKPVWYRRGDGGVLLPIKPLSE